MSARICQGARSAYWPGLCHRWRRAGHDPPRRHHQDTGLRGTGGGCDDWRESLSGFEHCREKGRPCRGTVRAIHGANQSHQGDESE